MNWHGPLPLDVGDYVDGVKQVAEEIMQLLNNKKELLMLGRLWGMGGLDSRLWQGNYVTSCVKGLIQLVC